MRETVVIDWWVELGEIVARTRRRRNWTQGQLASRAQVFPGVIADVERGLVVEREVGVVALVRIGNALGLRLVCRLER